MSTTKFEVGKTYWCRSIGDHECIFAYEVVARTAKRLTLKDSSGVIFQRGVYTPSWEPTVEKCKPTGTYSMCPVISADKHR